MIDLARQYQPVLILIDLALPGLGNTGTLKGLHANPVIARIPILALSVENWSALTNERMCACGAYDCLDKTYLFEHLPQALQPTLQPKA